MTKVCIFDQSLIFWPKLKFLTKIWVFDQSLSFDQSLILWPKFDFLTKVWIFEQSLSYDLNFYFRPTFLIWLRVVFLNQISGLTESFIIFDQNFDFYHHRVKFLKKKLRRKKYRGGYLNPFKICILQFWLRQAYNIFLLTLGAAISLNRIFCWNFKRIF